MKSKNKTFYVLGINAHHADSSVALCKNGQIIFAIEEVEAATPTEKNTDKNIFGKNLLV